MGNRFQRGTGCYKCSTCGKLTRQTGSGEREDCAACFECYGWENHLLDGHPAEEVPNDVILHAKKYPIYFGELAALEVRK